MKVNPTFGEVLALTRHFLDDANIGKSWSNWQVRRSINLALRQLHWKAVRPDKGWYEAITSFGVIADQDLYTLPSAAQRIKRVEWVSEGGESRELSPISAKHRSIINSKRQTGTPTYYFLLGGNTIGLVPAPDETVVEFDGDDGGPIRVNYIERIPGCMELDAPPDQSKTYGYPDDESELHPMPSHEELTLHREIHGGPRVQWDWDESDVDGNIPVDTWMSMVFQFVRRDERRGRYSVPEVVGCPYVSPWHVNIVGALQSLVIQDWPNGDETNSEWPDGATHLDIWMMTTDKTSPANPEAPTAKLDMVFAGNLLPTDDPAGDDFRITDLEVWNIENNPSASGSGSTGIIWDGRSIADPPSYTFSDRESELTQQNWINMIPPSPMNLVDLHPPYAADNVYFGNPITGTAVHHNTSPALTDASMIHEQFFEEHAECLAVEAALVTLSRHGIENRALAQHRAELVDIYEQIHAAVIAVPRRVMITNPDNSNVAASFSGRNLRG